MSKIIRTLLLGMLAKCVAAAFFGARPASAAVSDVSVSDLEQKVLESRRKIWSGEFEIALDSNDRYVPTAHYHIWFANGKRTRQESAFRDQTQVSIVDGNNAFFYSGHPEDFQNPDLTRRPAITMEPLSAARPDKPPYAMHHPLEAMFAPARFLLLNNYGLEAQVGSPNREMLTTRPTTWNGTEAITVAYSRPVTHNSFEYDVVPSLGYSIVRWQVRGTTRTKAGPDTDFETIASCEVKEVAPNIWYPKSVKLSERIGNKDPYRESIATNVVALNQRIDERVFSLAWGNLPANQLITPPRLQEGGVRPESAAPTSKPSRPAASDQLFVWDGQGLRDFTPADVTERKLSHGQSTVPFRGRSWGPMTLGLCGCVIFCYWAWRRHRVAKRIRT